MTDYTTIPDGDIDQDSPVTQPLLSALRDNPLAIQEADASAPLMKKRFLMANANANFDVPSNASGFSMVHYGSGSVTAIQVSDDGGSTWTSVSSSFSDAYTRLEVDLISGDYSQIRLDPTGTTTQVSTGTFTAPSGQVDKIRAYLSFGGPRTTLRAYIEFHGGWATN